LILKFKKGKKKKEGEEEREGRSCKSPLSKNNLSLTKSPSFVRRQSVEIVAGVDDPL